jgi:DNA-binding NtrC family response regulator
MESTYVYRDGEILPGFIGRSQSIQNLAQKLEQLRGQGHLSVLILGESGTGKELVARALHRLENESDRPFVPLNVAAIPGTLVEAELFGSEKGAYTDAKVSRAGKIELADGGDLFLDEIGDMPFESQTKLLRVLQDKHVQRVGSCSSKPVKFRLISATNCSFLELTNQKKFREDLFYRIADVVIRVPSLRDRTEDIPLLVNYFIKKYARKPMNLNSEAMAKLMNYQWPGNVRQLESAIKRAVAFSNGEVISAIELFDITNLEEDTRFRGHNVSKAGSSSVEEFERRMIVETLARHNWNRGLAMNELGMPRATFYRKINVHGIALP